ncbi:DUF7220 family protein [Flavobacterium keumense]|uniref:DUF7220 family protein n=1 Tax=Flavobacterium keumense TaxID=1306518 RepID=UPI003CC7AACB
MKPQTKLLSAVESISNAVVGILMSFFVQMWIFPYFGINVSPTTNMQITLIFFLISFCRSYFLRRFFNAIR